MMMKGSDYAEREALSATLLNRILDFLELETVYDIVGLGGAEAKVKLRSGMEARITINVNESREERWSVLEDAMAYRRDHGDS